MTISPIGEYCEDLLTFSAWVDGRTKANQATTLMCNALKEQEQQVKEALTYLASKRGISLDELRRQILRGEAKKISPDEMVNGTEG